MIKSDCNMRTLIGDILNTCCNKTTSCGNMRTLLTIKNKYLYYLKAYLVKIPLKESYVVPHYTDAFQKKSYALWQYIEALQKKCYALWQNIDAMW